jgi:hypothetical protein
LNGVLAWLPVNREMHAMNRWSEESQGKKGRSPAMAAQATEEVSPIRRHTQE